MNDPMSDLALQSALKALTELGTDPSLDPVARKNAYNDLKTRLENAVKNYRYALTQLQQHTQTYINSLASIQTDTESKQRNLPPVARAY